MKYSKSIVSSKQLKKVGWITLFWILVSFLQYSNGYATLLYFDFDFGEVNRNEFLLGSLITGLTAGIMGGSLIVFFWERWLRTKSYRKSLFYIWVTFTFIYFLVTILSQFYIHSVVLDQPVFNPEVSNNVMNDVKSVANIYGYFFWMFVVLITLIALLVNDKYGPGVFADFLMGKYFHPKREARIFMFLDLRSSTTIAENLGEEKYFDFLKEVYADITPAILHTEGEVYQYVGDEVVISWKPNIGQRNFNVINCFFRIEEYLQQKSAYYQNKYHGNQPQFKAGIHLGNVMAGEIGVIKREIAYSGDVLNTTARIQGKCNELGVNILLSEYLIEFLTPLSSVFEPVSMGSYPLRGKQSQVQLFTLQA